MTPEQISAAVDAVIIGRHSVRRFLPTPVHRPTVEEILAVASRAPSGTNTQPWKVHVLSGAPLDALRNAIVAAHDTDPDAYQEDYDYYPKKWVDPYLARRRKVGFDLYAQLGIGRRDVARMHEHFGNNYRFFGAPVGLLFTIDRVMERGSWLDYGMFLENVMLAARARGLDTCPQAAFCKYHRIIAEHLGLPAEEQLVCGMALGHADPEAPENALKTEREPVEAFASFSGF